METDWKGGKHAGCISIQPKYCQIVFTKNTGLPSPCYTYKYFDSKEKAIESAEKDRAMFSSENGFSKNMYRTVIDKNKQIYLEVQLQNDLIMKCDVEHLPLVEERIWTAYKGAGKYTYYVKSRASKKRNQEYCLFHRRAFPDLKEIDHINRDGLDNRSINIREGSGKVNANNKRIQKNNVSGVKGVYYEGGAKARWKAQWNDIDGVKLTKSFACAKWGEDEAFAKACQWREEQHNEKMSRMDGYTRVVKDGRAIMTPLNPANIVIVDD